MPLPPEVRRERRAAAKRADPDQEFPRRHCHNCNAWYRKTRKNKRFCSKECKEEFRRYGSAFGPLKTWLTKLIEESSKGEAANQFTLYVEGRDFRRQLARAGFIHRSMLKQLPPELRPKALLAAAMMNGKLMAELSARVKTLELGLEKLAQSFAVHCAANFPGSREFTERR